MKYNFIFVVLVYRNTQDLQDFFVTNVTKNKKVIVVNSFYDSLSDRIFKDIAEKNDADYITVPNRGYGAGNNIGIEYALKNYLFDYLIISNADIEIVRLQIDDIQIYNNQIIAPKIVARKGRLQNPNIPFKPFIIEEKLQYICYKKGYKIFNLCFYALSRLKKIIYRLLFGNNKSHKIYSAHGSFMIFPYNVICNMVPLFDNDIFLFNEELCVAQKASELSIETLYVQSIIAKHKEDGSVALLDDKIYDLMRDSYIKFYEHYHYCPVKVPDDYYKV